MPLLNFRKLTLAYLCQASVSDKLLLTPIEPCLSTRNRSGHYKPRRSRDKNKLSTLKNKLMIYYGDINLCARAAHIYSTIFKTSVVIFKVIKIFFRSHYNDFSWAKFHKWTLKSLSVCEIENKKTKIYFYHNTGSNILSFYYYRVWGKNWLYGMHSF